MKEPPRHALSPGGSNEEAALYATAKDLQAWENQPSRPHETAPSLLHAARIADEVLFYPALVLVIWGELSSAQPDAFGLFGEGNDKALTLMDDFGSIVEPLRRRLGCW